MKTITIIYGSTTGCTKSIAKAIAKKLESNTVNVIDVSRATLDDIENSPNLILGTSTWGSGDLQDDWDSFLPHLLKVNLKEKTIALFGLGDGESYPDTFVDGMGTIYEALKTKECKLIGQVDADGYSFSDSKALVNGSFVGLALDDTNQSNRTTTRVDAWLKSITAAFH
jgi:flavodoxin I